MTTLVSAFVNVNVNNRKDKDLFAYYEYGKLLLKSNIPKIIFLDEIMLKMIGEDYNKENTLLIETSYSDIYLNSYNNCITNFEVNTTYPEKDNSKFMFTICNKTEWIKQAILLNNFNTTNFVWVDFGIRHVIKCSDDEFIQKINELNNKIYSNIRIASIWNLDHNYNTDIYKNIAWYFAGGVFGGDKEKLLLFSEKMKLKCIDIINEKKSIMWEVNIWYLIYLEIKELFNPYTCDHNNTILENY
jgi:hypothetical protein